MTPDLLMGLWATGLVVSLSIPLCFLLCWLGEHRSSYI